MASQIRLRGITGEVEGRVWVTASLMRAGRLSSREVALSDASVSRRHAEIRPDREQWTLTDLGSTNGTFLNGAKVASGQSVTLKPADLVRLGDVTFVVDGIDLADTPPSEPSSSPSASLIPEGSPNSMLTPGCECPSNVTAHSVPSSAAPAIVNNPAAVGDGFSCDNVYGCAADPARQAEASPVNQDAQTLAFVPDSPDQDAFACRILPALVLESGPAGSDMLRAEVQAQPSLDETQIVDRYLRHAELQPTHEPITGPATSTGSLTICDRSWASLEETQPEEYQLGLTHGHGIVIGRQEGGRTEYLDPRFCPTQQLPGSGQRIVVDARQGEDTLVSRGHFTLVGCPLGIILVNGVPRRGGGIRPPLNGTLLLKPHQRTMVEGEQFLVKPGESIKIRLPNQLEVLICGNT